jgi:hypothetical protein
VASTVAPSGEWMRALSNYKAAPGYGNRTNALCAKINPKPAASFPLVTGRDANLRSGPRARISYGPSFVPAVSATCARNYRPNKER